MYQNAGEVGTSCGHFDTPLWGWGRRRFYVFLFSSHPPRPTKNAATRQRAAAFKAYVKMKNHFILVLGRKPAAITYGPRGARDRY